jgi:hypothetical protein
LLEFAFCQTGDVAAAALRGVDQTKQRVRRCITNGSADWMILFTILHLG